MTSYRPISLQTVLYNVFETTYVVILQLITDIVFNHQFEIRNKYGTIKQVQRVVKQIEKDFYKVWHTGKNHFPIYTYNFLNPI